MNSRQFGALAIALFGVCNSTTGGAEPNRADEPLAQSYSFERGADFLAETATSWSDGRKCVTCHTNGLALVAQSALSPQAELVERNRAFASEYLRKYLEQGVRSHRQYGSIEGLVATTAFLALSDARTGVGIQPATRLGLDHAWKTLSEQGCWEKWLKCNWPPFESDDNFGPSLMLVALGELNRLGEKSRLIKADQAAIARLQAGLTARPPDSLHDKAMRLWAGSHWPRWIALEERKRWTNELFAAQRDDGGWSMAAIAGKNWRHNDGKPQPDESASYPTAFATYVLQQIDAPDSSSQRERALEWLRKHQRASGRWFSRSPRRDTRHYLSHAATAFALMCLGPSGSPRQ